MMVLYYSWWDESTTTEWALFDLSIRLHRHVQGLNILFAGRVVLCLHYARGGGYWSYLLIPLRLWKGKLQISTFRGNIEVFTLGKKKSQVAFIPAGKGSLIPVHNFYGILLSLGKQKKCLILRHKRLSG